MPPIPMEALSSLNLTNIIVALIGAVSATLGLVIQTKNKADDKMYREQHERLEAEQRQREEDRGALDEANSQLVSALADGMDVVISAVTGSGHLNGNVERARERLESAERNRSAVVARIISRNNR